MVMASGGRTRACTWQTWRRNLVSHVNGGAGGKVKLGEDPPGFALGKVRAEQKKNDFSALALLAVGFDTGVL